MVVEVRVWQGQITQQITVEGQVEQVQPMTLRPQAQPSSMLVAAVGMVSAVAPLRVGLAVAVQANTLPSLGLQPEQGAPTQEEEEEAVSMGQQVQAAQGLSSSATRLLLTV
jgi:hypothetical protein